MFVQGGKGGKCGGGLLCCVSLVSLTFYFLTFLRTHHTRYDTLTAQLMEFAPPGTTKEQVLEMYMKFSDREQLKEEICKLWDGTYFIDLVVPVCLSEKKCVFIS